MTLRLNPYLGFRENTREAMEFYHSIFGGDLQISTFKEFHASQDSSEDDLVMHSVITGDNGVVIMASDTPKRMEHHQGVNDFSMSLSGDEEELLRSYFDKLAEGGTITMPLDKAAWGDLFGMCTDKFGVSWLVNISLAQPETT